MEAEDIRKKFGELPARTVGWAALFSASLIVYGIALLEKLLKGNEFVSELLLKGITVSDHQPVVAFWLVAIVFALIVLPIFLLVLLAQSRIAHSLDADRNAALLQAERDRSKIALEIEQDRTRAEMDRVKAARQSEQKALRCFTETMHAASLIRSRQTPAASHTIKTLEEIGIEYRVQKDFTTTMTKQFRIKAAAEALHFWETSIQPSSDATPMEYLSDIRFKVMDITDPANRAPVTYLQTQNDVRLKRICIYFLPRLLTGDPARTMEVSFVWPKYLEQLRLTGREDIFQNFNSAAQTKLVTIDFWFEDASGGNPGLDVASLYANQVSLLKEPGWSGFRYQAKDLPPGRHEHKLSVTWIKN